MRNCTITVRNSSESMSPTQKITMELLNTHQPYLSMEFINMKQRILKLPSSPSRNVWKSEKLML